MVRSPAGADIFVRSAGTGPVVVLIHGYAETSDSWAPLAAELIKSYTVVVPDLRGIGRSSRPAGGYDKKTQAVDIRAVITALGFDHAFIVSHDIGIMVAYAYAALYPDKVDRLVVMDAPIPGIAPWDDIVKDHRLWHFSFWGTDEERLVQGRERIYLDRIWNNFSATPTQPDEAHTQVLRCAIRQARSHARRLRTLQSLLARREGQPDIPEHKTNHAGPRRRRSEVLRLHRKP